MTETRFTHQWWLFGLFIVAGTAGILLVLLSYPLGDTACTPVFPAPLSCFPEQRALILTATVALIILGTVAGAVGSLTRRTLLVWLLGSAGLVMIVIGTVIGVATLGGSRG